MGEVVSEASWKLFGGHCPKGKCCRGPSRHPTIIASVLLLHHHSRTQSGFPPIRNSQTTNENAKDAACRSPARRYGRMRWIASITTLGQPASAPQILVDGFTSTCCRKCSTLPCRLLPRRHYKANHARHRDNYRISPCPNTPRHSSTSLAPSPALLSALWSRGRCCYCSPPPLLTSRSLFCVSLPNFPLKLPSHASPRCSSGCLPLVWPTTSMLG